MFLHQLERKAKDVCSDVDGYDAVMNLTSGFYGVSIGWLRQVTICRITNIDSKYMFCFFKSLNQTTCLCSPFVCLASYCVSSLLPSIYFSVITRICLLYVFLCRNLFNNSKHKTEEKKNKIKRLLKRLVFYILSYYACYVFRIDFLCFLIALYIAW